MHLLKTSYLPSDYFDFKTEPMQHQIESFNFAELNRRNFLLGDDQGLGKTKQTIDIALYRKQKYGIKHCLIVCGVNSLKYNWVMEVIKHSEESSMILGTRIGKRGKVYVGGSVYDRLEDLDELDRGEIEDFFVITNIETLRNQGVQEKLFELTTDGTIGMVVIDEIHKAKNAESKQGRSIHCLNSEYRMALSGTPLMNAPVDLFNVMQWLGAIQMSYNTFKHRYCEFGGFGGWKVVGYKNLRELRSMFEPLMLRRMKDNVVDLPEKIPVTEYVEMTKNQKRIYDDIRADILANIQRIKLSPNPLAKLIRLRQATGWTGILSNSIQESAKMIRMREIVDEAIAAGKKVLIFSNWTGITEVAAAILKEYEPAIITGKTQDIDAEKARFQENENCKVAIGTIGVMGTGHTLTAASTVIFLDKPWNQANTVQAEDRAHRIGTKYPVSVITLVCKDTIDERIEEIIAEKAELTLGLIDGDEDTIEKLNIDTDDLIDRLLS